MTLTREEHLVEQPAGSPTPGLLVEQPAGVPPQVSLEADVLLRVTELTSFLDVSLESSDEVRHSLVRQPPHRPHHGPLAQR